MPVEIVPGVYWVGAIDWNIRDFHGYLTDAGSTYNAFLIVDEKITLIDTVKEGFTPEMMARIAEIVEPGKIDYIISNHVEMDHSGGLAETIALVSPEKVFCSPRGKDGLSRHFKADWPFVTVKTGDELSLGRYTLAFLETPMLHWPDSMMTFLKEEQVLFSSDGFGAHLASSERFDDQLPHYPVGYPHQLKKYYANILMPMSSLVTQLLDKVAALGLTFKVIAPDHGLIYRNPEPVLAAYRRWAAGEVEPKGVVIYDSMWHSTEMLAQALTEGLMDAGVEAQLHYLRARHYSDIITEVLEAGLLLIGSPTLNNGYFPSVGQFLTYMKGLKPKNKAAAAFGSYGWSGQAVGLITKELEAMGMNIAHPGFQVKYIPDPEEMQSARDLGAQLAKEHLRGK
ncbi:MAG: FprA family A-type flavoprotein [Deltaproteobacteria bacterium]|nr:FprA family A-type flavoprotein [Deltaproteobacteria bacterium]